MGLPRGKGYDAVPPFTRLSPERTNVVSISTNLCMGHKSGHIHDQCTVTDKESVV